MAGKFIVFEGLDGSGLSTQASLLKEYLNSRGKGVILTKEQTDSVIGGLIKSSLKSHFKTDSLTLQLLFAADRSHHLSAEIEPALKNDKIVISDRYLFSTLAFGGLNLDMDFLKYLNSRFRKPDLTFILKCDPEVCLKRIASERFHIELFEKKEKMEKILENYLSLKDYFPGIHIIDGNRTKQEVFEDIRKIVDAKI